MQVRVQNNNTTTHSRVAECIEVELVWGEWEIFRLSNIPLALSINSNRDTRSVFVGSASYWLSISQLWDYTYI